MRHKPYIMCSKSSIIFLQNYTTFQTTGGLAEKEIGPPRDFIQHSPVKLLKSELYGKQQLNDVSQLLTCSKKQLTAQHKQVSSIKCCKDLSPLALINN